MEDTVEERGPIDHLTKVIKGAFYLSSSSSQFLPISIVSTGLAIIGVFCFGIKCNDNNILLLYALSFLLASSVMSSTMTILMNAVYEHTQDYKVVPREFNLMGQITFSFFLLGAFLLGSAILLDSESRGPLMLFTCAIVFSMWKSILFLTNKHKLKKRV